LDAFRRPSVRIRTRGRLHLEPFLCQVRSGGRTRTLSGPSALRTLLGLGFEVSGFPGLVEGRLLRAVDAEVDEPACSGLACIDFRDGAFDPLHGSADVQAGRVNADVPVVSIGGSPDCPVFRDLVDHVSPFLRGPLRPGDSPMIAHLLVDQEIYEEYRRGP